VPDEALKPAVDRRAKRRVSLKELKGALEKAMKIQQRRRKRRHKRLERQEEQEFIDMPEEDISERLDQLMERLTAVFENEDDAVSFVEMVDQKNREDKLETFRHLLHLETDEKIRCQQEEFFGDIEIKPGEGMT